MHTPVQAKDSDDDDDVTVTVDRDRFMDEFFEQVGASTPRLSLDTGGAVTHLCQAQQPRGTS